MVIKKIGSSLRRSNGSSDSNSLSFGIGEATLQYNIQDPGKTDILLGRGRSSWSHPGNQQFRVFVSVYLKEISGITNRNEKGKILEYIYNAVVEKGGRFLKLDNTTNTWFQVERSVALEKISQTLRDAVGLRIKLTPDDVCDLPIEDLLPIANETKMMKLNTICQQAAITNSNQSDISLLALNPIKNPSHGVTRDSPSLKKISLEHDQSTVATTPDTLLSTGSQADNQSSTGDRTTLHNCSVLETETRPFGTMNSCAKIIKTLFKGRNGRVEVNVVSAEKQRGIGRLTHRSGQGILPKQEMMNRYCNASERDQSTHTKGSQSTGLNLISMDCRRANSLRSGIDCNLQPESFGIQKKNPLYDSTLFLPSENLKSKKKKCFNRDRTGQTMEGNLHQLVGQQVAHSDWTEIQHLDGVNTNSSMDNDGQNIGRSVGKSLGKRPRAPQYTHQMSCQSARF